MPYQLSGLRLNRVDLVPDGSNPDAHIVLFKSKEKKKMAKTAKRKVAKKPAAKKPDSRPKGKQRGEEDEEDEDDDVRMSREDDDEEDELEEDDNAVDEEEEDDDVEKSEDDEDDEAEEEDDDEDEKPRRKSKTPAKKNKKKVAKSASEEADDDLADDDEDAVDDEEDLEIDEDVVKAMPKAIRAKLEGFIEKTNSRLARLQKTAKSAARTASIEKAKRERLEFVEKAKRVIPNLPGTHEEKGELYQALYSGEPVSADVAKGIVKLLKAGDAAIASLMSETGRGRARTDEESDAISELREKASEIQKANTKLTKEQAFEKACQENPKLFGQYKLEKKRATRDVSAH